MKTAQDSYTITIKQIVRFQDGRLSAIIHLDRPYIAEYHENRSIIT